MRVLLDTNVLLDVLLNRSPWVTASRTIWDAHDQGGLTGYIAASTLTDIFYIARRPTDRQIALAAVRLCLATFEICAVDQQILLQAVALPGNDFEDNLQIACATMTGLDGIVSRDKNGFRAATIPIFTPVELIAQLNL